MGFEVSADGSHGAVAENISRFRNNLEAFGTLTATGAVSVPALTATGPINLPKLKVLSCVGGNASVTHQHLTLTGAAVGDRVKMIIGFTTANTATHGPVLPVIGTAFEATISVVDQILQNTTDYSTVTFIFFLESVA